jgi:hypothetical protein
MGELLRNYMEMDENVNLLDFDYSQFIENYNLNDLSNNTTPKFLSSSISDEYSIEDYYMNSCPNSPFSSISKFDNDFPICEDNNEEEDRYIDSGSFDSNSNINSFPDLQSDSKNSHSQILSIQSPDIESQFPKFSSSYIQYPSYQQYYFPFPPLLSKGNNIKDVEEVIELEKKKISEKRKRVILCSNIECFNMIEKGRAEYCCKQCRIRKHNLDRTVSRFHFIINI